MRFSGRTQPLYPRYSAFEALAVIKRLGFDGVEICLETEDLAPAALSLGLVDALREQVLALGLAPHVVGFHKDYIFDDAAYQDTQTAVRLTPRFGANILLFSGTVPRGGGPEEWRRMVERTRALVRLAEDHGVVLAQEFEPGFIVGSTADLLRLFDEIPSPNLAANLDLGHMFLCDPDPLDAIRQVGEKAVHGHVENMRAGRHDHLIPDEGDMQLGAYLSALAQAGFTGALALDLYKYDYEAVAPQALAALRRLAPTE